jgi:hypothetical protein
MKTLLSIMVLAGAFTLGGAATEQWIGTSPVQAQTSSACYQNCANVRRWPAAQCQQYCKGRPKRK